MASPIFINDSQRAKLLPSFAPPNPQIREFHKSLPHYSPTPLISLPAVAKSLGVTYVLLKDESTRLGLTAFKILGASWATYKALVQKLNLSQPDDAALPLDVLASAAEEVGLVLYAATDGNHGRAVARMASYLGIRSRIFVPKMVDEEAKAKIVSEGAELEVFDGDYDQTVLYTKAAAEKEKDGRGVLISDTALEAGDQVPAWIVEGYQTMFDEVEEQVLEVVGKGGVSLVVTPVGVGSLAHAVITHFRRTSGPGADTTTVLAVEPIAASCLKTSLQNGFMTSVETGYTICTGMCCGTLSVSGWPVLKDGVDFAVAVEDHEVQEAIEALEGYGVLAGPCGAAALAGLRKLVEEEDYKMKKDAVVVLLCTEGKRGYSMTL